MMDLLELGKLPIRPDAPAGIDAKYEPEFEQLQAEIDKLASATGIRPDWPKVVRLAAVILETKSKDLKVASYLAIGLLETEKLAGFGKGLQILRDLLETFWEHMFPPVARIRGRINALQWFSDRTEAYLEAHPPEPMPAEQAQAVRERVAGLDQALSAKTEEAPRLDRLIQIASSLPVRQEAAPAAAGAPGGAGAVAAVPSGPVEISSASDAGRVLDLTLQQLVKIADFQLGQDPANPQAYELNRLCAWAGVPDLPTAEKGRTLIPPPDPGFLAAIKAQFAGETLAAIVALEGKIREAPFWLDLNRWCAQGLEKLGDKFKGARDMVCGQTALFLQRLPGLKDLSYNDGTPFADSETVSWLGTIGTGAGAGSSAPAADAGGGVEAEVKEALAQARAFIRENKLMEAVAMLYEKLSRGASAKAKMLWRMTLADVLLSAGQVDLARPHLGDISRQIDEYKLESWDPELSLSALRVIYEGQSKLEDPDSKPAAARTFDQIIRISPAEALKIRR